MHSYRRSVSPLVPSVSERPSGTRPGEADGHARNRLHPGLRTAGAALLCCALFLLVAVTPAAAQDGGGEADLILRFQSQVTFTVWGNGTTSNAFRVEASPGDALETVVLVKVLGRENTLEEPKEYTVRMVLEAANGTLVLNETTDIILPGQTNTTQVRMNATVPAETEVGTHDLRFELETGPWDPDQKNNAPRIPATTELVVGRPETQQTAFALTPRLFIGPVAFLLLMATPFVLRGVRDKPFARAVRTRSSGWWEDVSARWLHMEDESRTRTGLWVAFAVFMLLGAMSIVAAGGLAFGADGFMEAGILAALAAVVHLVGGTWGRMRRAEQDAREAGEDPEETTIRLGPRLKVATAKAVQTLLVVFAAALFWQQLAFLTDLFRWPAFGTLNRFVIIGLAIGAIYALIALGYTMVYGILKFINFAHGEIFMWGGFIAWAFVFGYGFGPLPPLPQLPFLAAVLIAVVLTGGLGALTERVAYRPLRGGSRLTPLVTAIALSLLLQALAQFFFGTQKVTYTQDRATTYSGSGLQAFFSEKVTILDAVVDRLAISIFFVSILLMFALHLFVRYSRMGRAMRAVADDLDTARTIGIDVDRVIMTTFVIGSMLAAVGGIAFGLEFGLKPTMGLFPGIKAFTAAVVGGIGNIYGAFLGGFLIGLAENVGGQFIQSELQKVITFAILIIFLLFRPQGILGDTEGVDRK